MIPFEIWVRDQPGIRYSQSQDGLGCLVGVRKIPFEI